MNTAAGTKPDDRDPVKPYLDVFQQFHHEKRTAMEKQAAVFCLGCPEQPECREKRPLIMITRLINACDYHLDHVIIIHHTLLWHQLVVVRSHELFFEKSYEGLGPTIQSFLTQYSHLAREIDTRPDWAFFYPCPKWLRTNIPLE